MEENDFIFDDSIIMEFKQHRMIVRRQKMIRQKNEIKNKCRAQFEIQEIKDNIQAYDQWATFPITTTPHRMN